MFKRTSVVDQIKVDTFGFSSIFEIGDTSYIQGYSRALALQRDAEIFYGKEGNYNVYDIYREELVFPKITENIQTHYIQHKPIIKVKNIDILGVSSSAVLHIGNTKDISMESRVKHFRQFVKNEE